MPARCSAMRPPSRRMRSSSMKPAATRSIARQCASRSARYLSVPYQRRGAALDLLDAACRRGFAIWTLSPRGETDIRPIPPADRAWRWLSARKARGCRQRSWSASAARAFRNRRDWTASTSRRQPASRSSHMSSAVNADLISARLRQDRRCAAARSARFTRSLAPFFSPRHPAEDRGSARTGLR